MPVTSNARRPPIRATSHVDQIEEGPLGGAEGAVNDHEYEEDRQGHDDEQPGLGSLLAFVLPQPTDGISRRQFHLFVDLLDCLLDGAAEITAPDADT